MDFSQVEAEFQKLKRQLETGALTEVEFKARLQELMLQDEQGRWWMIGYETGQWYYHDGEKWVQGEPPPVAERRRKQVEALCQEGKTAVEAGDWAAAIEKFEAALALEPGHPEATQGLAEAKARAAEAPKPAVPVQPVAPPAAPSRRQWVWAVAGVIGVGVIGLIILMLLLQSGIMPGPGPGPGPEGQFWADPEVIMPGECTVLRWNVSSVEQVRLHGPGFDANALMLSSGERKVCPGQTAEYELMKPDGRVIATVVVEVRE